LAPHANSEYQRRCVSVLPDATEQLEGKFVGVVVIRDCAPLRERTRAARPDPALYQWRDLGLADGTGDPRPAPG